MNDIQYVSLKRGKRIIHVESDLGIVNIYVGLTDRFGRRVENVQMLPDDFAGSPKVKRIGCRFVELKGVRK